MNSNENPFDAIRLLIAFRVKEGFDDKEAIIEAANVLAEFEFPDAAVEAFIEKTTIDLLDEHYRIQATWVYPTDWDKLDIAFSQLEEHGVLARQNFACCQTCGFYEIEDEIDEATFPVKGFTFYHLQDTETAVNYSSLCLSYSSLDGQDASSIETAKQIVEAQQSAGLQTRWDGRVQKRIEVVGLDWKKRRKGTALVERQMQLWETTDGVRHAIKMLRNKH